MKILNSVKILKALKFQLNLKALKFQLNFTNIYYVDAIYYVFGEEK